MQDFGKGGLEMQVHQGTLGRRSNHMQTSMNMDSPPQRTTASGTLSGIFLYIAVLLNIQQLTGTKKSIFHVTS